MGCRGVALNCHRCSVEQILPRIDAVSVLLARGEELGIVRSTVNLFHFIPTCQRERA
jgi:hypothetical protein